MDQTSCCLAFGIIDSRQSLKAIPDRIVAVFERYSGIGREVVDVDEGVAIGRIEIERNSLDDRSDRRKHRNHLLLAIDRTIGSGLDAEA